MRDLHIACGQVRCGARKTRAKNVARMITQVKSAHEIGCELVLFPELNRQRGISRRKKVKPLAEPINGPSVQALSQAAREMGIAIALWHGRTARANTDTLQTRSSSWVRAATLWASIARYTSGAAKKEWADKGTSVPTL